MKFLLPLALMPAAAVACGPFFYPAPPTLEHYPERLPGKTLHRLLREANSAPEKAMTFEELAAEVREVAGRLAVDSPEKAGAALAAAQEHNREGQYRKRFANCLNDFQDLLADGGAREPGFQDYLGVRLDAMDWDDGLFTRRPEDSATVPNTKVQDRQKEWDESLLATAGSFAEGAGKASAVLRPHWLVLAGAWQFKHARFEDAELLFRQVLLQSPQHPRAEIARFMLIRTALERWREARKKQAPAADATALMDEVKAAFTAYEREFPAGRFVLDLAGWRAGFLRETGDLTGAIGLLAGQLGADAHPEIAQRAAQEIDRILADMDEAGSDVAPELPLDALAAQPLAALAVVYHYLDRASQLDLQGMVWPEFSGDEDKIEGKLWPMLRVRRQGQKAIPALAQAVARQSADTRAAWRPAELAVLAWAATEAGEHPQAVRLCHLAGPALEASDDLRFVEALALQRAGDLAGARAAFEELQAKFPRSPLRSEVGFRLATILRDQQEGGAAIVELLRLLQERAASEPERDEVTEHGQERAPRPEPVPHLPSELEQWLDTLLNFAPLPELEKAYAAIKDDPKAALVVSQMLRWRLLAAERFAEARRYAPPAAQAPPPEDPKELYAEELSGGAWLEAVARLEQLTRLAAAPAGAATRAQREFDLAEAWAADRGQLIRTSEDVTGSVFTDPDIFSSSQRAANARLAGYGEEAVARELEQRDELRHALPHYLAAAADLKGSSLAARAWWRAIDSLRLLAAFSSWDAARAFTADAGALSRQWVERLRRECPDSNEARLGVWWSFPPPAELPASEGAGSDQVEKNILARFENTLPGADPSEAENNRALAAIKRLAELALHAAAWDPPRLLEGLEAIRREFHPEATTPAGAAMVNHLDDLELFLHEPDLLPAARLAYFKARLHDDPPAVDDDPDLQPWRDYVEFLALVREGGPVDPETGLMQVRPMSVRMREFLEQYPHSHKREAAMARLAIASVRESHGHAGAAIVLRKPPEENGQFSIEIRAPHPEAAEAAQEAVAAYEKEFPEGHYLAEVKFWGGVALMDEGNWAACLPVLTATLEDPSQRGLHMDAALNLAYIFMRLLENPEGRPAYLVGLRECPAAQKRLRQFMHSPKPGSSLLCLEGYLREQLQQ